MTPEERQLITGLFERMRGFALTGKDGEAEALIKQQVGSLPDAPYMLVQSVLIQEQALQQADARIKALEEQVREAQQQHAPTTGAGSFLGGFFGSRAAPGADPGADPEPGRGTSVPAVGSRAALPVYGGQSAWAAPQAGTQPPGTPTDAPPAPPQAGGGFLKSAMATAAGVAGGMLAANAISSWLGGNANTGTPTATGGPQQVQATSPDTAGTSQASHASAAQPQDYHEAAYDDDDWLGGGGDFEA
jgi:hypothetical protein